MESRKYVGSQLAGSLRPHCSQATWYSPSAGKLSKVPQSGQNSSDPG